MRILIMLSSLAMGGAERNIVSVLPYLNKDGVTPLLCTLNTRRDSPLTQSFAQTGVPRLDMQAKRLTDPAALRRFMALIRDQQIDLVHSQDQDVNIYAALAHRFLNVPTVMTRHVVEEPTPNWRKRVRAQLVLWSARYGFNRIIAVSEALRQHFAKLAGIPLARIETIYNGIDFEPFNTAQTRAQKRAELGWQPDQPVVSMVAVLRPGKGHEVLFEAVPPIKAAVPNVKIKLIGTGKLENDLRNQAASLGDTVEFMGQRMDVPELLIASDVLVLPSWSEALPTVLIEAGAASLPVVATNVGGASEIAEDGKSGYVIPPGNASELANRVTHLLQNPVQARQMGQYAHERVTRLFSLERQAQQTIALYEKVLAAK